MSEKQEVTKKQYIEIFPEELVIDYKKNNRFQFIPNNGDCEFTSLISTGQLQPVIVEKNKQGKFELVVGFRRALALLKWNKENPENKQKIKAFLMSFSSSEESFLANIRENVDRKELSPMDKALICRRLKETFHYNQHEIAQTLGLHQPQVSDLLSFFFLSEENQVKLHKGELTASAAKALVSLPQKEQDKIVSSSTTIVRDDKEENNAVTKIDTTKVKEKVREKTNGNNNIGKRLSRSVKEIREFCEQQDGPGNKKATRRILQSLNRFCEGTLTDEHFIEIIEKNVINE